MSTRAPDDARRKFYTWNRITMNHDRLDHEPDKFAVVGGDVTTEWVKYSNGRIVCRERSGDKVLLEFDDVDEFRERDLEDATAVVYYHADREGYAVEINGDLERVYGSKAKLTEDWSWIYEPLIPEVMFTDYGYDIVPDPEAFRIAIVPHDDRGLDVDLLIYDPQTGEVSDEYTASSSGVERPKTAPTSNETASDEPDDPGPASNPDGSENSKERGLAEARTIAGPEDEPEQQDDDENESEGDDSTDGFGMI